MENELQTYIHTYIHAFYIHTYLHANTINVVHLIQAMDSRSDSIYVTLAQRLFDKSTAVDTLRESILDLRAGNKFEQFASNLHFGLEKAWNIFESNVVKIIGGSSHLIEMHENIYKSLSHSVVSRMRHLELCFANLLSKWLLLAETHGNVEEIKDNIKETLDEIKLTNTLYQQYHKLGKNISMALEIFHLNWNCSLNFIYPKFCDTKITENLARLQNLEVLMKELQSSLLDNNRNKSKITTRITELNIGFYHFYRGKKKGSTSHTFSYIQSECIEGLSNINDLSTNIRKDFQQLISNVQWIIKAQEYNTELDRMLRYSAYLHRLLEGYILHGNISLQNFLDAYVNKQDEQDVGRMILYDADNVVHSIQEDFVISSQIAIQKTLRYISTNGKNIPW